jgi:glutaminyl-peptide cyclotransferase
MRYFSFPVLALALLVSCNGCGNGNDSNPTGGTGATGTTQPVADVKVPDFSGDSAYAYVDRQVLFGPRVPNTTQHDDCGRWLEAKFREFADQVVVQKAKVTAFDNKALNCSNIIASFNPTNPNRIVLCAHWDTRPWADQDADPANHTKPILGANDAASGAGVLMEVARILKENKVNVGVDLILFDIEDYGQPQDSKFPPMENSYGLGSQYWSKNPHVAGYQAKYGILLDMVGGKNSQFPMEGNSMQYAPELVKKVWTLAQNKGYSQFHMVPAQPIQDDHYYMNLYSGVPTIDIVHLDPTSEKLFHPVWHTMQDNMDNIDRNTLKAVGQTLLEVIYREDKAVM